MIEYTHTHTYTHENTHPHKSIYLHTQSKWHQQNSNWCNFTGKNLVLSTNKDWIKLRRKHMNGTWHFCIYPISRGPLLLFAAHYDVLVVLLSFLFNAHLFEIIKAATNFPFFRWRNTHHQIVAIGCVKTIKWANTDAANSKAHKHHLLHSSRNPH